MRCGDQPKADEEGERGGSKRRLSRAVHVGEGGAHDAQDRHGDDDQLVDPLEVGEAMEGVVDA